MAKALSLVGQIAGIVALIPSPIQPIAAAVAVAANVGAQLMARPEPARGTVNNIVIAANAPIPLGIGESYVGGNLVHDVGYGGTVDGVENPFRAMVFEYCADGPVEQFLQFYADFTPIDFDGGGGVNGNAVGYYQNYLRAQRLEGETPESDALNIGSTDIPQWDSTSKISGHAQAMFIAVWDKNGKKFASGLPQLGLVAKWRKCYDPRLDSTYPGGSGSHRLATPSTWSWSANPALHTIKYAIGGTQNGKRVAGCGYTADGLDWPQLVAWANLCDANEWEANGHIYDGPDISRWDNIKSITQAGGAVPLHYGGKLSVRFNAPVVSLDTIAREDLADGEVRIAAMQSGKDRKNGIVPRYRSANHRWEYVQSALVTDAAYVTEDGEPKTEEVQYNLVTAKDQAAQLAAYELVNRREFTVGLTVKPRFMGYRLGDALTVDLPDEGLDGQLCTIVSKSLDPATLAVQLVLATETAGKDDFALGKTGTAPPTPTLTTPEELDEAIGSNVDDQIVDTIANDDTLTRAEKSLILIPEMAWLDAQYASLIASANSLGLDASTLTAAHDAWFTYLEALDPEWNDTSADTPLIYSPEDFPAAKTFFTQVYSDLAPPGQTSGGAQVWSGAATPSVASGDYWTVSDDSAGAVENTVTPSIAATGSATYSSLRRVKKDAVTARTPRLYIQGIGTATTTTARASLNTSTGAVSLTLGTVQILGLDASGEITTVLADTAEWLLLLSGAHSGTSTNTRLVIEPCSATASHTGGLDMRDIAFWQGSPIADLEAWYQAEWTAWFDGTGRDAFRRRLGDYREALAATQSLIDATVAMSFLVTEDNGGSARDIGETVIPTSIEAFRTTGYSEPGDGGGALLRYIGTTAPAAGDYDPRLVPGETDSTMTLESGGSEGDGFFADGSPIPRWFDIFVPSEPINIMKLGARPYDPALSGAANLAQRSLNTRALRKATRLGAGGTALVLIPEMDQPFDISFSARTYDRQRIQVQGHLRNTRGDELARYGVTAWTNNAYFSKACFSLGHMHAAYQSYGWRGGATLTWSETSPGVFEPIIGTNSNCTLAGNILPAYFGTLNGTEFTLDANGRANPSYGLLFPDSVGPLLREGYTLAGDPIPMFPDAAATYNNRSLALAALPVGTMVLVATHSGYEQGIATYTDPYDDERYRGHGGLQVQWSRREYGFVTANDGTSLITFDREFPDNEEHGGEMFIAPCQRPDIIETSSNLSGVRPHMVTDVQIVGDGTVESVDLAHLVDGDGNPLKSGHPLIERSGVIGAKIDLGTYIGDVALGGNCWYDGEQKYKLAVAQRKLADIAAGTTRMLFEVGTLRGDYLGDAVQTGLVVNEVSRDTTVKISSVVTTPQTRGLNFNHSQNCVVDIEKWTRAKGGSTAPAITQGTSTQAELDDEDSGDAVGFVGTRPPIRDNYARIGEWRGGTVTYFVQILSDGALTVAGRCVGHVTRDAVYVRGPDNAIYMTFSEGSIRLTGEAVTRTLIDSDVPRERIIGLTATTVASARCDGVMLYEGARSLEDADTTGAAVDVDVDAAAGKVSEGAAEQTVRVAGGGNGITLKALTGAKEGDVIALTVTNANTGATDEPIAFDGAGDFINPGTALADVTPGASTRLEFKVTNGKAVLQVTSLENQTGLAPAGDNLVTLADLTEGTGFDYNATDDDITNAADEGVSGGTPTIVTAASRTTVSGLAPSTSYRIKVWRPGGAYGIIGMSLSGVDAWTEVDANGNTPHYLEATITTPGSLSTPHIELLVAGAVYPIKFEASTVVRPYSADSRITAIEVREI